MKILTGNEAFAAMAAGQKIECRHAESNLDFDDIRNFPATVFIDTAYEFRIAVVYMTIGLMQVPESITEDPVKGTQCFVPSVLTEVLSKSFKWKNSDSDLSLLHRGLVHLYEENAIAHARALIAVSRGLTSEAKTFPWEEPADAEQPQAVTASQDKARTEASNHVVKKAFENSEAHGAAEIETDPVKLVEKFTAQISACTQAEPVLALRYTFSANGHLEREHVQHLFKLVEEKCTELDPEAYKPAEAEQLADSIKEYEKNLDLLLKDAANAKTPAEANALTRYTKPWTEEQRKPLLDAIHKRLNELNPPEAAEIKQPPSLLVQIQNAVDLTELDCLEIETAGRHPDIQPKLMAAVKRRRAELENQAGKEAS